jgi:hypothetical protein
VPVTNKIATATRPDTGAPFEIESADDFVLTSGGSITSATFTGLLTRESGQWHANAPASAEAVLGVGVDRSWYQRLSGR